jgi:hypothetical protein
MTPKYFIHCLEVIGLINKLNKSFRRDQRHFFIKGKIISLQTNSLRVGASLLNYTILLYITTTLF